MEIAAGFTLDELRRIREIMEERDFDVDEVILTLRLATPEALLGFA